MQNILALKAGGGNFNTMFFSKELNIPIYIIDFISILSKIKSATSFKERIILYDSLNSNTSVLKVLQILNVRISFLFFNF